MPPDLQSRIGGALFCLLFAVIFGGVGVLASWAIAASLYDGVRAKDWVRVKALVASHGPSHVGYGYSFGGRTYSGDRLGSSVIGGSDVNDDWQEELNAKLAAAQAERKPITVFVNPDNPSESMVDREIRWSFLLFLVPFAFGFGGVGLGALWALSRVVRGDQAKAKAKAPSAQSEARGGLLILWIVTFFWNVISFPIALLVIPQVIRDGEWMGLFVLLFPLIGLLLLFGAITGTISHLRTGAAVVSMQKPREVKPARPASFFDAPAAAFAHASMPASAAPAADPKFENIEKILSGLGAGPLTAEQKSAFARLTPEQHAAVAKVAALKPSGKKIAIIIIGFILLVEFVPALIGLIFDR